MFRGDKAYIGAVLGGIREVRPQIVFRRDDQGNGVDDGKLVPLQFDVGVDGASSAAVECSPSGLLCRLPAFSKLPPWSVRELPVLCVEFIPALIAPCFQVIER